MILSDKQIRAARERREIIIEPWDDKSLGTNSYDVHLGETLVTYASAKPPGEVETWVDEDGFTQTAKVVLDAKRLQPVREHKVGPAGFVLMPNKLYLGVTQEYTESHKHVPFLDGKSSVGRAGTFIHCTAGRGDVGFCNHWTLEIVVVQPVRVYAGMPIGQLIYFETGPVDVPYNKKLGAKYNERCAKPQPSMMWKNFPPSDVNPMHRPNRACICCDCNGHEVVEGRCRFCGKPTADCVREWTGV